MPVGPALQCPLGRRYKIRPYGEKHFFNALQGLKVPAYSPVAPPGQRELNRPKNAASFGAIGEIL